MKRLPAGAAWFLALAGSALASSSSSQASAGAVAGSLTEIPGQSWSGIHVQRGDRELANLCCRGRPVIADRGLQQAWEFAPPEARRALDDSDPRFDAWF